MNPACSSLWFCRVGFNQWHILSATDNNDDDDDDDDDVDDCDDGAV